MADHNGRRTSWRVAVALPAVLIVGDDELTCAISNLSLGGAQLDAGIAAAMGQRVRLEFVLDASERIDAIATVRWRNGSQIGVQFDGLRAREVWALSRFLRNTIDARREHASDAPFTTS